MRSGTSSTESGNTYEQLVRTWRLTDFISATLTASPKSPAPRFLSFQHRALRPWDDIVESTPPGFVAWQIKHLVHPLSPTTLAELLCSLRDELGIHRAVLAVSHALPHPSGLDLMLVDGLANASRIAHGKLPRFDRDKKEHECLELLAKLLGDTDLQDTFATLGRLEVRVLHGKPDVHALAVRALHPLFEDPEGLVDALLAFVVHTAAPGVQVHFDALEPLLRGFPRRKAPWVPVPSGPPDEEVLLWRRDSRGVTRTLWLSTREPDLVVADLPGMLLGSERNLWRWETYPVLVPFGPDDYCFEESDWPDEGAIELIPVDSVRITNLVNGVTLPLGEVEGYTTDQWVLALEHVVEPVATIGDTLLVVTRAAGLSGGAHGWQTRSFLALDLQSSHRFTVLTPTEANDYLARFGDRARQQLADDKDLGHEVEGETPTITICTPFYDDSLALRLRLQFTFEVCYASTDEAWDSYTASTTLEAETLPATLSPLATAPAVLRAYWDEHPKDERCGWTRVPSAGPAREHLEALVRAQHGKLRP